MAEIKTNVSQSVFIITLNIDIAYDEDDEDSRSFFAKKKKK
jgi:hypothetical protein